jgi:branched-chain amino acid transport system substrate-binding protein
MEKTRREFVKLVGGAALGAGAILASRSKAGAQVKPPKGVPSEPVKIGIITLLQGTGALLGVPGLRGAEIWLEKTNAAGGILGRKVEFYQEEETVPRETVEKFRKLTLQNKVDVVVGLISTGNGLAVGPVAEELGQLWLSWDATTQKGVEETMPKPKYSFRAGDNECNAIAGALATLRVFPNIKTVAGINNDYSYGRDCWEVYKAVLQQYNPNLKFVLDLWPKLGEMEFTSHIAAIKKANPDLLMSSFWGGDNAAFFKQADGADLFKKIKGCFITGGMVYWSLKKEFTPPGIILGYDCFYFQAVDTWPLGQWFIKRYLEKYKEYPGAEVNNSYFTLEAYKTAIEKLYAITGRWPTKEEIAVILPGIYVPSVSGYRGYSDDNRMMYDCYLGISTHKNPFDFVTIEKVEIWPPHMVQKPAGTKLHDWIKGWKKA